MQSRIFVSALALVGLFAISGIASSGDAAGPARRWAIVTFASPVQIGDQFLMGKYLIVHDDAKMAKGEACTSIYRFDPATGPREQVVAFHCVPAKREVCATAKLTIQDRGLDIPRLVEYQFAGDNEGHGVPAK
ncbi:MAG TPA: hypothetical protein VFB07_10735 [Vicinamibacterales bacterium]|nr:hypothetical protein [Vicinamibacterales bacterium]